MQKVIQTLQKCLKILTRRTHENYYSIKSFSTGSQTDCKTWYEYKKLESVVDMLASDTPLPARCRPHKLKGNWIGYWECHIEPDWMLVYDFDNETLGLAAIGTHADLFK